MKSREDVHVIITGRNAKDELLEVADLVTDMDAWSNTRSGLA
jgi:ATP:corrinoid adenosyltransferase